MMNPLRYYQYAWSKWKAFVHGKNISTGIIVAIVIPIIVVTVLLAFGFPVSRMKKAYQGFATQSEFFMVS